LAAACGGFVDAVLGGTVRHRGNPLLLSAVVSARKRTVGQDLWAWSRKSSAADISPLVAATLALWAVPSAAASGSEPFAIVLR
jgi:hypothetical protein